MTVQRDKKTGRFVTRKRTKNATPKGKEERGKKHEGTKKGSPNLVGRQNKGGSVKGGPRTAQKTEGVASKYNQH